MASAQMESLKCNIKKMMELGFAPRFDGKLDHVRLRNIVQAAQERMPVTGNVSFKGVEFNGVKGEECSKEGILKDYVVFYIHGGGLICGNAFSSRGYASTLVNETGRKVYTASYCLAPEHNIHEIYMDAFSYYKGLTALYPDTPIFLIGESGGAYLCLAVSMLARDNGIKAPAGIVPYSAPIEYYGRIDRHFEGNEDFTVTPDGLELLSELFDEKKDYYNDKYANPYLDDLKNLPPMFLAWDANESLAADQDILVEKVKEAGGILEYKSYPHCFHAFATSGRGVPESSEILDNTLKFFDKYSK